MRAFWIVGLTAAVLSAPAFASEIRVVDSEGNPVENAEVRLVRPPRSTDLMSRLVADSWQATTDREGRVALDLPWVEEERLVLVDHPAFAPSVTRVPGESLSTTIRLTVGEPWGGEVAVPDDEARTGRACWVWKQRFPESGADHTWRRCVEIAPSGRFTLRAVPPEAELTLELAGFLPRRFPSLPDGRGPWALREGVLVRGTVSGSDGRWIAGAAVSSGGVAGRGESDERGRFTLVVPALPVELTATAPGFHDAVVEVTPEEAAPEIVLSFREQVSALVLDESGGMVGEVRAGWSRRFPAGFEEHETELDTVEGEVRLPLPGAGRYRFRFEAAGFEPIRTEEQSIGPGETLDLGALIFERGAGIEGALVDGGSGDPVGGAEIELLPTGVAAIEAAGRRRIPRTVSDPESGAFSLHGMGAGRFELRVRRAGFAVWRRGVRVARNERLELGEIELDPGVVLRGTVVGRDGAPRPGLTLRLYDPEVASPFPLDEAVSGLDGEFVHAAVAPGRYRIQVTAERLLLAQEIDLPEREEAVDLRLTVGGVALRGQVLRDALPVSGAIVSLSSVLDPGRYRGKISLNAPAAGADQARFGYPESVVVAMTGESGVFEVEDAPVGLLWADVIDAEGRSHSRRIYVPDEPQPEITIDVSGVTAIGRVVDAESGEGVDALVGLRDDLGILAASRPTGDDGSFELADLQEGSYTLGVEASGFQSQANRRVEVRSGMAPLVVELRRGEAASLEVRLRDRDGTPLAGSLVTLLDATGTMTRSLVTDADGIRRFEDLAAGRYTVVWSDPRTGTGASPRIEVGADGPTVWSRLLRPGTAVEVECEPSLCAGRPVELLTLHTPEGAQIGPYLSTVSSALRFSTLGRLSLGSVSPGRYRLSIWVAGQRFRRDLQVGGASVVVPLTQEISTPVANQFSVSSPDSP